MTSPSTGLRRGEDAPPIERVVTGGSWPRLRSSIGGVSSPRLADIEVIGQPARRCMSRHRSRGATTVEFVMVAPLVFMLVFGFMEGVRVFSAWLVLNNEAREAARFAAVATGQLDDPGQAACLQVLERTAETLDANRLACEAEVLHDLGGNVVDLSLTLRYSVAFVIPVAEWVWGSNAFAIAARSSMRPE